MALRKRIKNRIKDKFGKKGDKLDDINDTDLSLESVSETDLGIPNDSDENIYNNSNENITNNIGLKETSSNNILNNKDYVYDFCKEKKFNQEELKIITKIIRAELEPILSIITIMINIIKWNNIPISLITLVILLFIAYKNYVFYLPGMILIVLSLCMLNYKFKLNVLISILAYLEYMTDPAIKNDITNDDNDSKSNKMDDQNSDDNIKRWQLIKRAKKVKKKIKKVKTSLGSIQYFLWEISIQFGKLRSIYFFKANQTSINICYGLLIFGLLLLFIPFRIIYTLIVLLVFFINNPLRNKPKIPKIIQKIKTEMGSIAPDIPSI